MEETKVAKKRGRPRKVVEEQKPEVVVPTSGEVKVDAVNSIISSLLGGVSLPEGEGMCVSKEVSKKLKKEIRKQFNESLPSRTEIKALVRMYYSVQDIRINVSAQSRSIPENESILIEFIKNEYVIIEAQLKAALDVYTDIDPIGWTLKQVVGIGPVIAAGLLSNFDISRAHTAGAYWRYCGLDPTLKKVKGEKLRYNQQLKTLVVFKLGESFVKVANRPNATYGKIYADWKTEYVRRNETGEYKEDAARILAEKNYGKTTDAYAALSSGKLPQAQIHARARRKPLMILTSHLFDLQYRLEHHKPSPIPYSIAIQGHAHVIENELLKIYEEKFGPIPMDG